MSAVPDARLRFRPMNDADVPAVMANERAAYTHPWSEGIFRDCLHSGYSCWVVETDSGVVGHGVMSVAVGETHILNICIAPSRQGRGYGRALLRHLLDLSREYGALMAFLEVRPSNTAAVRLYESIGFSEVGRRRNYYPAGTGREDAIVMALGLDDGEPVDID
ncbi:MAG TPA: ribosomal protein S18-alanine N-acetyltransferase [Gammaproteobacteria bacterium]|nr:ribosomal protein S18-alanine N-acetyltransferase [Gammaproteobacteria bacterium]